MPPATPDERPRVLIVTVGLGPGGAERLVANQARSGAHEDWRYAVCYLMPQWGQLAPEITSAGVAVTCLGSRRTVDLRWVWRLRRRLIREPAAILHTHSPYVGALVRLMVLSIRRRSRPLLVHTEHNRWSAHGPTTRVCNRLTYGRNAAVIAVSDEVCSTVSERYRGAVQSVVHGVDLPAVRRQLDHRRAVRDELGLTDADIVIGIVANLRSQKAYPDLLAAARLVVDANPIVTFVAVGQGPDEADLHRLHGELGLGDRFRFLGMRLDALRVMAGFDIFTLSSVHEGLPVALMDALALGLPVVATDIGGIPEALTGGRDGVLVPPGRPDLLAAELLRVSGDRQVRSALAIRAAKRGLDFDMRRAIERIEGSYTDVLESGALLASHRGGGGK